MTGKLRTALLLVSTILVVTLSCNLPFTIEPLKPTSSPTEPLNATSIAQTVIAEIFALTTTPTANGSVTATVDSHSPTLTPDPSGALTIPTATFTATQTQRPCNQAAFLADVTISDGTDIQTGTNFTKTWRLQNTGSCTWTSGYHVVFENGDRMNAPSAIAVTGGTIPYGGSVEVSVSLTAPASAGTYRGNFRLRSPEGVLFGVGGGAPFYVEIEAVTPVVEEEEEAEPEPVVEHQPDLIILSLTLNPSTPTRGDPVTVTVQTKNIGNAVSGPYSVRWYAGENYAAPACTWNVDNSNPNGGRVLSCVYPGYPSWYPSLWTKAVIDPAGAVDESNEGNNSLRKNIKVDP